MSLGSILKSSISESAQKVPQKNDSLLPLIAKRGSIDRRQHAHSIKASFSESAMADRGPVVLTRRVMLEEAPGAYIAAGAQSEETQTRQCMQ